MPHADTIIDKLKDWDRNSTMTADTREDLKKTFAEYKIVAKKMALGEGYRAG